MRVALFLRNRLSLLPSNNAACVAVWLILPLIMNENWQSFAAIAVIIVTVILFAVRAARKRKKPGCGGGCGCGK